MKFSHKLFLSGMVCVLPLVPTSLFSLAVLNEPLPKDQPTLNHKSDLEKKLQDLQEERRKYEQWARYADREAYRLMSRDWVEYQEYLRMQQRAQSKVQEIDMKVKIIEQQIKDCPN